MKIEVTEDATIAEWLKPLVTEGTLDLSALPEPEDVSGLKTALQKERENVAQYSKIGKPDEIAAKIADLTEKAKGSGKGAEDAQAKLDAMASEYDNKINEYSQRISEMQQRNARAELQAELSKAGFIPESIADIATSAMARLQFNDDGTPKVLTADGKPMIGSGADHGATLADLAKELASVKAYAVRDAGKPGGGKPPNSDGGKPEAKTINRAQFDALSQFERAQFSKSGGKVVD